MRFNLFLYGIALASAFLVLKYLEHNYLLRQISLDNYLGTVALLFTIFGIWLGFKLITEMKGSHSPFQPEALHVAKGQEELPISKRELEVLHLIAQGYSNQEIADALFLSLSTVKSHSYHLFTKLDVKRRTQAVKRAQELKLLS